MIEGSTEKPNADGTMNGNAPEGRARDPTANGGRGDLPRHILFRCFLRSLLLQANWNPRGMQGLGFVYAIEPALVSIYPNETDRRRALKRHIEPFNTHPYMAEAILGGAIHHELAVSDGRSSPSKVKEFKGALGGPLAALGDSFFWASLRPASAALAAMLLPFIGAWTVLVFLLTYNGVHLAARTHLFLSGLRLGDGLLEAIGSMRLASRSITLKKVTAVFLGVAAVTLVTAQISNLGYPIYWTVVIIIMAGGMIFRPSFALPHRIYLLLLGVAGLGALLGLLGLLGTE